MLSVDDLKDFRYVENKYIINELSKRVKQQLEKSKNPNLYFQFQIYSAFVDFKNIGYIDVYSPIYHRKNVVVCCGSVVTRVELVLKSKTIDEVFKAYKSQEKCIFKLKESTLILHQNELEKIHRFIFFRSRTLLNYSSEFIHPSKNDRLFNISSPKMGYVYFGYQKENHYDQVEIYDYSSIDKTIIFLHSIEKFQNMKKMNEILDKKPKIWFNIFKKSHKQSKGYERL